MTEGPTPGPARRGRRDPELEQALVAEEEFFLGDNGDTDAENTDLLLMPGDVIAAKVTHTIEFDGQPSWFTYGIQTHVQAGEDEEEAFIRAASIVNNRVLDLAFDAQERVEAARQHYNTNNRANRR